MIETHPVQTHRTSSTKKSIVPSVVTLRAYEVYKALFGEQEAIITGSCRGGFGAGELVALLYARGFARIEWREKFDEALTGMENL